MAEKITVKDILEGALQKEIDARFLYQDMSRAVREPAAKDAFRELSDEEERHRKLLEMYLHGEMQEGTLGPAVHLDYHLAEHLEQPAVTPDMALKDVFLLAATREKLSHDFYLAFAGVHPEGKVRTLLQELAEQEMGHKRRVEYLYTEVAFPQTDGG